MTPASRLMQERNRTCPEHHCPRMWSDTNTSEQGAGRPHPQSGSTLRHAMLHGWVPTPFSKRAMLQELFGNAFSNMSNTISVCCKFVLHGFVFLHFWNVWLCMALLFYVFEMHGFVLLQIKVHGFAGTFFLQERLCFVLPGPKNSFFCQNKTLFDSKSWFVTSLSLKR